MNEEEKKAIEVFKNLVDDLDGAEDWANIVLNKEELKSLRTIKNLIEKQEKEIEREKQYTDFYKDLVQKQQKEIEYYRNLIFYFKDKLNNIDFETEIGWRKIEKLEKIYGEIYGEIEDE